MPVVISKGMQAIKLCSKPSTKSSSS